MFRILNDTPAYRKETRPVPHPDVHFLNLHGERVAFDANTLCAVHCDEAMFAKLKRVAASADVTERAVGSGLPLFSVRAPHFMLDHEIRIRKLVLNLTHACNLRCRYCFASGHREPTVMRPEHVRRAIDLFAPGDRVDISFFGGEPLLAWDGLVEAVAYAAAARTAKPKLHVTTNGTLLDEKKIAFLCEHDFSMIVSLDGPADIHDAARPFAGTRGEGSFDAVMKGLSRVQGTPLARKTTLRATFDSDRPDLARRLAFLNGLVRTGYANGVSVEPATLSEGCGAAQRVPSWPRIEQEYHHAAEWYVRHWPRARCFHFDKMLRRLRDQTATCTECGGGRGYVTVGPKGELFACHRENGTRIGHIETGFDKRERQAWLDNRFHARQPCRACWIRHLCGGGCRQAHIAACGNPHEVNTMHCGFKCVIVRECLWILTQLDRAKGRTDHAAAEAQAVRARGV